MKIRYILLVPIALALMLVFAGCVPGTPLPTSTPGTPAQTSPASPPSITIEGLEATLESIYEQVNPSVVNISVLSGHPQTPGSPFPGPQPFGRATGSGFVWDSAGHIVTNHHVVADADRITVTFYDGTILQGQMVGSDADSDLAVVEVDMSGQQVLPVTMADSSQLKVGQLAIAIGNPFGLQGTMTVGFISGLGRVLPTNENSIGPSYSIPDIIQTDAAINPGNSGGVLLDISGKVIGVTSSIATASGTNSGVGFAIPSAIVQQVVPVLIDTGRYEHPYLGVSVVSLDPDLAGAMNLPAGQRGALVASVTAGGPADVAGLRASQQQVDINGQQILVGGDVIIALDGQPVKSSNDLITLLVRSGSVGQTINLTVLRDAEQIMVPVTLGARPAS